MGDGEELNPGQEVGSQSSLKDFPTPREICRGLDEYVIGQTNVKIALSVGVYNHYKRVSLVESQRRNDNQYPSNNRMPEDDEEEEQGDHAEQQQPTLNGTDTSQEVEEETCEVDKSNIMIIGPTGSGKTLLLKTLARIIDVPLVITDATCLTQAGYVGEDVESILFKVNKCASFEMGSKWTSLTFYTIAVPSEWTRY